MINRRKTIRIIMSKAARNKRRKKSLALKRRTLATKKMKMRRS